MAAGPFGPPGGYEDWCAGARGSGDWTRQDDLIEEAVRAVDRAGEHAAHRFGGEHTWVVHAFTLFAAAYALWRGAEE